METLHQLLNYILHIDVYLFSFVATYGVWVYVLLFCIIFCETGLIVTPFLPGDSLLFTAGSIAASSNTVLDIGLLLMLLIIASVLGNQINYRVGSAIGARVFTAQKSWLFNKKYLEEAHQFYIQHGGKTILIARFIPIIRTFAPFVAGVGSMPSRKFFIYNILSAIFWIGSLLGLGYFFGSLPFIQANFSMVLYTIIFISLLPPLYAYVCRKS